MLAALTSMSLRVLIIGCQAGGCQGDDILFLQDVLREIEQERLLPDWPRIEAEFAATLTEAERSLITSPPHAILLDLSLEDDGQRKDSVREDTFHLVESHAPDVPVILLVDKEEDALTGRLMRDGAEDYLLKREVDCAPLAHALRNAVLRHRLLSATRASSLTDSLTGLANRAAFLSMAARDRKLAERLRRRWLLLVAEPRNLTAISHSLGEHRRDLELVEAAERLRGIASPADLLARIDERHFAIGIFDGEAESVEEAWARIRAAAAMHRINVGASIFDVSRPLALEAMMEQAIDDLPKSRPQTAGAA